MKKVLFILLIIIILTASYTFLFGKLFTYSPIIVGFDKHEQKQTIIHVQKGAEFKDYKRIDTLFFSVENFHDLKFKKKPKIFIFKDSLSFVKRSFSKARFSAYPTGRFIISTWALKEAEQGKISLEIYVKHELSHVLIFQHKGILVEIQYPKWLLEGIAVYSTNQIFKQIYGIDFDEFLIQFRQYMEQYDTFEITHKNDLDNQVKKKGSLVLNPMALVTFYLHGAKHF